MRWLWFFGRKLIATRDHSLKMCFSNSGISNTRFCPIIVSNSVFIYMYHKWIVILFLRNHEQTPLPSHITLPIVLWWKCNFFWNKMVFVLLNVYSYHVRITVTMWFWLVKGIHSRRTRKYNKFSERTDLYHLTTATSCGNTQNFSSKIVKQLR